MSDTNEYVIDVELNTSGTLYHDELNNRNLADQHPISAITNLQTTLDAKQNTLSVGSNIQIVNNTISATDTTYTPGSGLTLTGTEFSANVVNNVTSTSTTNALSANMGKELQDQISNLNMRGKYLSNWDATTGLPKTDPVTSLPYTYHSGDYFIVGVVGDTNYRPSGSQYTGAASTTLETEEVSVNDTYTYDGTVWTLLHGADVSVTFASLGGQPSDNLNLASALNTKQDTLTAGANIQISNNVISVTGISGGQDQLVAGDNITINNILSTTSTVTHTGDFTLQNNYTGTKSTVGTEVVTLTYNKNITSTLQVNSASSTTELYAGDLNYIAPIYPSSVHGSIRNGQLYLDSTVIDTNTTWTKVYAASTKYRYDSNPSTFVFAIRDNKLFTYQKFTTIATSSVTEIALDSEIPVNLSYFQRVGWASDPYGGSILVLTQSGKLYKATISYDGTAFSVSSELVSSDQWADISGDYLIKSDGTLWCFMNADYTLRSVSSDTNWQYLRPNLAVKADGTYKLDHTYSAPSKISDIHEWSKLTCGSSSGSGSYWLALGIYQGQLYSVGDSEAHTDVLDSGSTGWTDVSGYYATYTSQKANAVAIKDHKLYYIDYTGTITQVGTESDYVRVYNGGYNIVPIATRGFEGWAINGVEHQLAEYDIILTSGTPVANNTITITYITVDTHTDRISATDTTYTAGAGLVLNGTQFSTTLYQDITVLSESTISLTDICSMYKATPSADTTYVISSSSLTQTGKAITFEFILVQPATAVTVTLPTASWLGTSSPSTPPDVSTGGKTYLLAFRSFDNGTTWIGNLQGSF